MASWKVFHCSIDSYLWREATPLERPYFLARTGVASQVGFHCEGVLLYTHHVTLQAHSGSVPLRSTLGLHGFRLLMASTTSSCPWSRACCRGDALKMSSASGSLPTDRRYSTTSSLPMLAACSTRKYRTGKNEISKWLMMS